MTTDPRPPDDASASGDDSHSVPDRFVVGDQAASSDSLIDSGHFSQIDGGAGVPAPVSASPSPVTETDDEPGLITYETEPVSVEQLARDRAEAKLKLWIVKWIALTVSVLSIVAVACSDSPTTTALGLVGTLLGFAGGVVYGRHTPPK